MSLFTDEQKRRINDYYPGLGNRPPSIGDGGLLTIIEDAVEAADATVQAAADAAQADATQAQSDATTALGRVHATVADSAAIQAIAADARVDGMIVVEVSGGTAWRFNAASSAEASATVLVPSAGTGRWLALNTTGTAVASSLLAASRFTSTEQTGNGSAQNIAHGLGVTPGLVWWAFSDIDSGLMAGPPPAVHATPGVHDATNIKMTVSTGVKYYVFAIK